MSYIRTKVLYDLAQDEFKRLSDRRDMYAEIVEMTETYDPEMVVKLIKHRLKRATNELNEAEQTMRERLDALSEATQAA